MADGTVLNAGSGGDTIRTIDRTSAKTQVVGLDFGGEAGPEQLVSGSNPLPVSRAAISASVLLSAAASTNATSVKSSAGILKAIQGYNAKASAVFLKLYDKSSAPTVGTDTPVKTIYLPAASAFALDIHFKFSNGIAYALTGAAANADTTALVAGDIVCLNIDYN